MTVGIEIVPGSINQRFGTSTFPVTIGPPSIVLEGNSDGNAESDGRNNTGSYFWLSGNAWSGADLIGHAHTSVSASGRVNMGNMSGSTIPAGEIQAVIEIDYGGLAWAHLPGDAWSSAMLQLELEAPGGQRTLFHTEQLIWQARGASDDRLGSIPLLLDMPALPGTPGTNVITKLHATVSVASDAFTMVPAPATLGAFLALPALIGRRRRSHGS